MSLINKEVSDFTAKAYQNGEFKTITKNDLLGKWSVFVFYPADFSYVCPTELGDLADNYSKFKEADCEIYTISTDTEFVHKAWHDASETIGKVTYPMIADPTGKISKDFDVYIDEAGLALRGSFVINPDGKIVSYEVNDTNIGREASELLRKVQMAQFVSKNGGEVCPAKWKPGAETLKPSLDLIGKI